MAAAMATLDVLEADNSAAMAHMQAMGSMLSEGLAAQAESHGVPIKVCGPSAMPFITFDADDATPATRPRAHAWCTVVAEGGSWLHPHHNWYLSLSHTAEDIAETLQATDGAPQAWACCAVICKGLTGVGAATQRRLRRSRPSTAASDGLGALEFRCSVQSA